MLHAALYIIIGLALMGWMKWFTRLRLRPYWFFFTLVFVLWPIALVGTAILFFAVGITHFLERRET